MRNESKIQETAELILNLETSAFIAIDSIISEMIEAKNKQCSQYSIEDN